MPNDIIDFLNEDEKHEYVTELWDSIKHETPTACLFGDEGFDDNVWLPKSQVFVRKLSRGYEVKIPMWLAEKKGIV